MTAAQGGRMDPLADIALHFLLHRSSSLVLPLDVQCMMVSEKARMFIRSVCVC